DNLGDEGERCGICMDVVLDRGVLDCCQHWYGSFNGFVATFHPFGLTKVYDAIGGSKNDDESDSRDDGWSVEGKNNTLSFPSYYIDENLRSRPELNLKEWHRSGKNDHQHCLVDTSTGKLSICVADSGETAVVVSRINGENVVDEPNVNRLSSRELTDNCKAEQSVLGPDCCTSELNKPLDQGSDTIKPESIPPSARFGETVIKCEPDENESKSSVDVGLSFASTLSEDDKADVLLGQDECPPDETVFRKNGDKAPHSPHEDRLMGAPSTKKVKVQRRTKSTFNGQADMNDQADVREDFKKRNKLIKSSADEIRRNTTVKNQPVDIMSIVKGTKLSAGNRSACQKEAGTCAKVEKNAAGLRVKKIMRRPTEEKESDAIVQKLRKEIREAVRNKPSDEIGKSIFDPNLLTAFRAAVAGSASEPAKKASSAVVKAKKLMLQKGKARENLTKKIYATSSGKEKTSMGS
ncbi:hypothetical protein RDABS01_027978, partial [Bienertia sinuspersici]